MLNPHPASRRQAFTLMEIMVALLIFGATIAALATVIHTSTRAWRVGHSISEMTQTAHVARDVMMRDLENLYFLPEQDYNKAFRRQLRTLAQQVDSATGQGGYDARGRRQRRATSRRAEQRANEAVTQAAGESELTLADMTPPIDLSFHGSGGEEAGELSFARIQPARWEGDPETLGVRRVRYYVKDKVLYREERDPYGFRPGAAFQIDPEDDRLGALSTLSSLFNASPSEEDKAAQSDATPEMIEDARQAIPTRVEYAEPLCEGVSKFSMAFGYFRDALWQETADWDSGEIRYRGYVEEDEQVDRPGHGGGMGQRGQQLQPGQVLTQSGNMRQSQRKPDNLPGYIRITLGIQPADGKGRTQEYTLTYAMPQAQEDDVMDEDRVAEHGGDLAEASQFGNNQERDRRRDSRQIARERRERRAQEARSQRGSGRTSGRGSSGRSGAGDLTAGNNDFDVGWGWGTETGY